MMSIFSGIPSSRLGYQVVLHLICWLTQSPWDDIPYSVDPQGGENHDVSWEFHGLLKVFPHRKKWTTSWTWNFRGFPTVDFTEKNNEYPNTILRLSHSTCEARESPAGLEPAAASDHVHSFSLWRSHLGSILTPNILVWFKLLLFVWVWKRLLPKVFGDGNEETGVSEVNTIPCLYIYVCGVLKAFWDGKRIHIL